MKCKVFCIRSFFLLLSLTMLLSCMTISASAEGETLTLNKTSISLTVGAEYTLLPTASAVGAFEWSSSNTDYVTVSDSGLVSGVQATPEGSPCTVTLKQTLDSGDTIQATCTVSVFSAATQITLDYSSLNLEIDKTCTVNAAITPNVTTAPIRWITDNEALVSLSAASDNKSVVITGLAAGTCVVSAVNTDNFVTASVTVTVIVPIKTISLDAGQLELSLSSGGTQLTATYTPTTATVTELMWTSSNQSVATVDENGFVTPLTAGTTIITVQPRYNPNLTMAQCVVEFTVPYIPYYPPYVPPKPTTHYTDVTDEQPIKEIEWAYSKGYMNGISETEFSPDMPLLRCQLWTILARIQGKSPADYQDARAFVTEAGISDGSSANAPVTLEDFITMLYRMAGSPAAQKNLPDGYGAAVSPYASDAVSWALEIGLIPSGKEPSALQAEVSRADSAALLYEYEN